MDCANFRMVSCMHNDILKKYVTSLLVLLFAFIKISGVERGVFAFIVSYIGAHVGYLLGVLINKIK